MKNLYLLATLLPVSFICSAQQMTSVDGKITVDVDGGRAVVKYTGIEVLEMPSLGAGSTPVSVITVSDATPVSESYEMITGKRQHCTNQGNAYRLDCNDGSAIEMRLYDDGVTFRYLLDSYDGDTIGPESTAYKIPDGTKRWIMSYNQSYEDFFPMVTDGKAPGKEFGYPVLVESAPGVYALVTEADIAPYHSASYLSNAEQSDIYRVTYPANDVKIDNGWASPWRMAIIGNLATIVESTLVTDVSEPCQLDDVSWIEPGSVSWVYWAYNHGSNDYQIIKKYVDMAYTLDLPYVLIDAEWDEMTNGGDIEDIVAYARSLGVKPLIWYNSSTGWTEEWGAPGPHRRLNKPEDREREFAWLDSIGIAGVKIDFFSGDTQPTMQYCIELLEAAAQHHQLVNFHGATTPRGWQRTYPNLMSVEAVYGAEWYNNKPVLTNKAAAHNATLPFTRNVIGPMDYTPVTFSDSQHPHITSNAHELALAVVYESGLLHWADKPESYLAQPAEVHAFMTHLPTVWDDTRLLGGYPGEYVVMARRSGDTWYVGALNGFDEPQTVELDWSGITDRSIDGALRGDVRYTVQTFADSETEPWSINTDTYTLEQLPKTVTMQPRGGYIMIINPQPKI